MKKSIIASLVISALVAGCGSGGSSTASSDKYNWQVVQLKSVSESTLNSKCVIYADSALNDGEVITAYIAESDFNIIYHNADGTIEETIPADEISDGLLTIDSDDVPDEGYVTLEEVSDPRGGDTGSYMFSVQKSLLSDLVLNIATEQGEDTCYTGDDYREVASGTALVNVQEESENTAYYQSSYDQDSINGKTISTGIPVDSPYPASHDVLITAFNSYDSDASEYTELSYWAFVDSAKLYETSSDSSAELNENGLTDVDLSTIDSVDLDSDSGVIVIHEDESYFWQPIYTTEDQLTLAYDSADVDVWNSYFSGTLSDNDWLFTSFNYLGENETYLTLKEFSSVDDLDDVFVSSDCDVAADFCIDTNSTYNSDDFDYQRVHIRLTEASGSTTDNITYQSIYSEANEQPIVLESSLFDYSDPTLTRAEFSLVSSDASMVDAVQYLMTVNINLVTVGEYGSNTDDDTAETDLYNDINGFVSTDTESSALYQEMLSSDTTTLMNAYELE